MQLSWCQETINRGYNISKTPPFKVSIIPAVEQHTRTFPAVGNGSFLFCHLFQNFSARFFGKQVAKRAIKATR